MPMPPVLSAIHRHVAAAATGAAAATLGAAGILGLLRDSIAVPSGVLILVVFVVGSAAVGVRAVGLAAAVAAAVGFDYFLTAPYYTFNIDKADDLEVTVLLLVVGLIVNEIALWGRHEQARASRETGYLDGVLRATELAARGESPEEFRHGIVGQIVSVLGADSGRIESGPRPSDDLSALLERDGSLVSAGAAMNVDRSGLPTDREILIPLRRSEIADERIVVAAATRVARPTQSERRIALALADQIGPPRGSRA